MEDYVLELKEYSRKLKFQIAGINKILAINSYGLIEKDIENQLLNLKSKAKVLENKLNNNEFEIAVVGLEKTGKSTFANAIMGNNILPSKDARCTYTATCIRYGEDKAKVEFFTRDEFENGFREKLALLGIEHTESISFETLSFENYQKMFESLDDKIKKYYGGNVNEDIKNILIHKNNLSKFLGSGTQEFSGADELEGDYFKGFIQDPQFAIAVKSITIQSSKLNSMKNAIIYDVPGLDSPTQIHKDQTIEKMRLADAIVLIVSAHKPSFTGPLVEIFRNEADYDGIRFGDKMFVFANMADMATTLDENINTIKKELKKHRIMKPENYERIIVGSSRAKLESIGKIHSDNALSVLKEKEIDDGIDKITKLLEEYNKTERFSILKIRINRIQTDVYNIFKDLFADNEISLSNNAFFISSDITTKLLMDSQNAIAKELESYRANLRRKFNKPSTPITDNMRNKVISNITVDNFGVREEELIEAKNHSGLTTNMDVPTDIDHYLRNSKYSIIYNSFFEGVVNLAIDEHHRCDEEITKIFTNNLGIKSGNPYFNELVENIQDYINRQKDTSDNKGYYKSLVERFSIDLFEILMKLPYGDMSRWNKFVTESSNFFSLSMFDSNKSLNLTPDKQPLLYLLLLHNNEHNEMQNYIKRIVTFLENEMEIQVDSKVFNLVTKIVFAKKKDSEDFIKTTFERIDKNKNAEIKYDIIYNSLDSIVDKFRDDGIDMEEIDLNIESYEKYFNGKRNKTPEDVKKEINDDIQILQKTLDDIVVNAICIEKPFLALEFQTIDNIIRSLSSESYRQFIVENIFLIASEQYANLEAEEQRSMTRTNILKEIEKILREMNQGSLSEEE